MKPIAFSINLGPVRDLLLREPGARAPGAQPRDDRLQRRHDLEEPDGHHLVGEPGGRRAQRQHGARLPQGGHFILAHGLHALPRRGHCGLQGGRPRYPDRPPCHKGARERGR